MPLDWPIENGLDGWECWDRRNGCLGVFISAEGVETNYLTSTGTALTVNEIANAASHNDIASESVPKTLDNRFDWATTLLINMLDPAIVAPAGRLSSLERLHTKIPRKWSSFAFADKTTTEFVRAFSCDDAIVAEACIHAKMAL